MPANNPSRQTRFYGKFLWLREIFQVHNEKSFAIYFKTLLIFHRIKNFATRIESSFEYRKMKETIKASGAKVHVEGKLAS